MVDFHKALDKFLRLRARYLRRYGCSDYGRFYEAISARSYKRLYRWQPNDCGTYK